jgi:hypothetical protein
MTNAVRIEAVQFLFAVQSVDAVTLEASLKQRGDRGFSAPVISNCARDAVRRYGMQ